MLGKKYIQFDMSLARWSYQPRTVFNVKRERSAILTKEAIAGLDSHDLQKWWDQVDELEGSTGFQSLGLTIGGQIQNFWKTVIDRPITVGSHFCSFFPQVKEGSRIHTTEKLKLLTSSALGVKLLIT